MDSSQAITHISLCAGYGGIDIGLNRVIRNLRTVALSEIEGFVCANLVAKMEEGLLDVSPLWTNLKTFPWEQFHGLVDILSGGFPCQPFSSAGKRVGDEDPRHLFPHILRGITSCNPRAIFLENVEGIISAKLKGDGWRDPAGTPVLLHVLRELERVGYRATAGVFSSAEIGATHQRKRVYILAVANSGDKGPQGHRGLGDIILSQGRQIEEGHSSTNGMVDKQRNPCRPLPPGPDQWWWEPSRVLNIFTRIANRHGPFDRSRIMDDAGSVESHRLSSEQWKEDSTIGKSGESVADTGCGECDGRQNGARTERTVQSESGKASDSRIGNVANNQSDGWREGRSESGGEQGGFDAAERGESTMADAKRSVGNGVFERFQERYMEANVGGSGSRTKTSITQHRKTAEGGQTQPPLGRDSYGSSSWMDYAELCQAVDNRTDELRLLGNGVDPDVAAKAFVTLYNRLFPQ